MEETTSISINFDKLEDPRRQSGNFRHKFMDILHITIIGILCGCDEWGKIEETVRAKEQWLKTFPELPCGIPTWQTLSWVVSAIDPLGLQECFFNRSSQLARKSKDV